MGDLGGERMIVAVYRCLYGSDFVEYSIRSVLDAVDKVVVVWGGKPFADVDHCVYKGKRYDFPKRFDDLPEIVQSIDSPKVEFIEHYHHNPRNQWAHIINNIVTPRFGKPDAALFMHVGMVWRADQLLKAFDEFFHGDSPCCNTRCVETWRGLDYRIPERLRAGCGFWKFQDFAKMPETWLDFQPRTVNLPGLHMLNAEIHNLRYSQNPNIMFWRQLVIMAYVAALGDSTPDPNWFEDKWLTWDPETNNQDLEMAINWKHLIPAAIPYDTDELPAGIRRDLVMLQKATSNKVWRGIPS